MGILYSNFLLSAFFFRNYLKIYLIVLLPLALLSLIDAFCIVLYNVPLNYDIFLLAINSNINEVSELLSGYVKYFIFFLIIYMVLGIYIVKSSPRSIPLKSSLIISIAALFFILISPIIKREKGNYVSTIKAIMVNVYPGTIYYALKILHQQSDLISQHNVLVKNFRFNAGQQDTISARQVYVMIIGESSRYDHWGINNYFRNTSPHLKNLNDVISFDNMVTGGYITELSVPMLITRATASDYKKHYYEKSIVTAFKEAKYKTYWISNQVDFGDILMHSKEADESYFLSSDAKASKGAHSDMELVSILEKILKKNEEKVFVVLHTLGSHYDYDARYPDSFNVFRPSTRGLFINPTDFSKKNNIINSYDNSILYTDAVVNKVVGLIQQTSSCAWVSYISDHGENLFDDTRKLSQHAYFAPSKYVAHVPWFIWTSPIYKQSFPEKVAELEAHKTAALGSENVFYTLTDLGNITFKNQNADESAASKYFKPQPQLILGGNGQVFNFSSLQ